MSRTLSEHDIALLLKLAPECSSLTCNKSESSFRSILAPVANHYAKSPDDFAARLMKLTDDEFIEIVDLVRAGKEGVSYLPVAAAEVLIEQTMRRAGMDAANELYALYESGTGCE